MCDRRAFDIPSRCLVIPQSVGVPEKKKKKKKLKKKGSDDE
jgi:hypothetical protein